MWLIAKRANNINEITTRKSQRNKKKWLKLSAKRQNERGKEIN